MQLQQLQVKIGLCSINNDPLDFKRNYEKIYQSIVQCKKMNCSMRIGGELEIPGYTCQDHFLQYDTTVHSWEMVKDLLVSGITNGIVVQVGCPVLHKASLYNGTVIMYNSKVIAIRVKMHLADGGNYYQTRYFSHWKYPREVGQYKLPLSIQLATGQNTVPIGSFILDFNDTSLAYQICEETWISNNPMIDAALDGAQIFINASASEIQRGKIKRKIKALEELTQRHGGAYAYVNIKGGLGTRNYFEGCCIFCENGSLKQITQAYDLNDVQVKPIIINLTSIRNFRLSNKSFQKESHGISLIPRVNININIATNCQPYPYEFASHKVELKRLRQLYEIPHVSFEPSMYIWDVLRKSKSRGFFLPISGGLDSFTVALIVYNMCFLLIERMKKHDEKEQILRDIRKVLRNNSYTPQSPKELCHQFLYTAYLATRNSSLTTRNMAKRISEVLGCKHRALSFDSIYQGYQQLSKKQLNFEAKYLKEGGSWRSDLAKQNLQARSRMVLSYYLASLELQIQKQEGFLLVLGSSNLDESLRGYFTKYDCSSADINPIGSFSKIRLKEFLAYFQQVHKFDIISEILVAIPTAELRPLDKDEIAQSDEEDMGLTYVELQTFGHLRKVQRLGPVSMFDQMYCQHSYKNIDELALKIKRFFTFYAINRHKATILPPSFHFDQEGCDDNRLDMRPFIYATDWSYQFEIIDQRVKYMKQQLLSQETRTIVEGNQEK